MLEQAITRKEGLLVVAGLAAAYGVFCVGKWTVGKALAGFSEIPVSLPTPAPAPTQHIVAAPAVQPAPATA